MLAGYPLYIATALLGLTVPFSASFVVGVVFWFAVPRILDR